MSEHETAIICDFKRVYNVRAIKAGQSYSIEEALAYLRGLMMDTGTLYYASKAKWKYPMNQTDCILADIFDLHVQINSDPKKKNNFHYDRPFELIDPDSERKAGTLIPLDKAKEVYHMPVQTKTQEEIKEINRQKMLAKKQKEWTPDGNTSTGQ